MPDKIPCPSCTFRGPVWLGEDRSCVYCGMTWEQQTLDEVWDLVPWEWWLEYEMIKVDELPDLCRKAIGVV